MRGHGGSQYRAIQLDTCWHIDRRGVCCACIELFIFARQVSEGCFKVGSVLVLAGLYLGLGRVEFLMRAIRSGAVRWSYEIGVSTGDRNSMMRYSDPVNKENLLMNGTCLLQLRCSDCRLFIRASRAL